MRIPGGPFWGTLLVIFVVWPGLWLEETWEKIREWWRA